MALRVDMTGNATGFTHMLNTARTQLRGFSNSVTSEITESFYGAFKGALTGMLTFQGIQDTVEGVIGKINELRSLSDQLGSSDIESIQRWEQAFDRAGGSVEIMTRLVGQFQDQRQKAMGHDMAAITARQQLEGMGFSMSEINPSNGMDPMAFMGKAFNFANANKDNAAMFESIFGPHSARFAAAGNYFAEQKAPIDPDTYEQLKETEKALDQFKQALDRATGKLLSIVTWSTAQGTLQESMTGAEKASNLMQQSINRIRAKGNAATPFEKQWLEHAVRSQQPMGFTVPTVWETAWRLLGVEGITPSSPIYYHRSGHQSHGVQPIATIGPQLPGSHQGTLPAAGGEDLDVQNIRDEWRQEEEAARESLDRINETHMTIGDRLRMIGQDLQKAHENTLHVQSKLNSPTLGLSTTAFNQMTDIQKEELKHKLTMDLMTSQSRESQLKNDIYQAPLQFQGDQMARVGLYSAAAVRYNPLLGINQQMNQHLITIAQNTSRNGQLTQDSQRP